MLVVLWTAGGTTAGQEPEATAGLDDLVDLSMGKTPTPPAAPPSPEPPAYRVHLASDLEREARLRTGAERLQRAWEEGELRLGRELAGDLLEDGANHPEILLYSGLIARERGRLEEAASLLRRAAEAGAEEAHLHLAVTYLRLDDPDRAESELVAYLSVSDPGSLRERVRGLVGVMKEEGEARESKKEKKKGRRR